MVTTMKNRILLDIHTHTIASGHAYGTVRENALAASAIAIKSTDTVSSEISEDLLKQYFEKIKRESRVTVIE